MMEDLAKIAGALIGLVGLAIGLFLLYIPIHFIIKYW